MKIINCNGKQKNYYRIIGNILQAIFSTTWVLLKMYSYRFQTWLLFLFSLNVLPIRSKSTELENRGLYLNIYFPIKIVRFKQILKIATIVFYSYRIFARIPSGNNVSALLLLLLLIKIVLVAVYNNIAIVRSD